MAWWLHLAAVAAATGGEEDRRPRILHPSLRLSLLPQPAAAAAALTSSTTAAVVEVTEKAHTPCFSLLLSPLPLQAATAAPGSGSSGCNWRQWQAPCLSRKNRQACFLLLFSTDILDVSPADSLVYLLSICW